MQIRRLRPAKIDPNDWKAAMHDLNVLCKKMVSVPQSTLTLPSTMEAELEAYQVAAQEGRLVRVQSSALPRSNARAIWQEANGPVPEGFDVDHIIQRQHGGTTELSNLQLKLSGLNRSEGASARWLMGNDPYVTVYNNVRLNGQP